MPCGAKQDGRVMVERADRMWSTGEGNGKPLQYSCVENPMNIMKRQKDRILKEELLRSVGAQYATGDQIANIRWIIKKAREFQKNIYFCFIDYAKAFDCVDHNKLWKILKEMGIADHLTCLLRNLYASQEATVRTGHGTTDWFQIGNGVSQGCILSPCLFNFYAEYIMRNAGLEEAQAGIKIARRNINNLRYADDTTIYGRK